MARKVNPSIKRRFAGPAGRVKLARALCAQQSVAGDELLAKQLVDAGFLLNCEQSTSIATQGNADDDMYMIISGSVAIIINGREIAVRRHGTHVGEMALLDPTVKRSATLVAQEDTLLLKLPEAAVTCIAKDYPEFWRRLAVEIASRLRERTRAIREPNSVPIVFIGSASEARDEATHARKWLTAKGVTCRLWTKGVFQLSRTTIEDLTRAAGECDFAVLLLSRDDMGTSRGCRRAMPRDNVIFELGLFMGAIGRERTFILSPKGVDLKLPTDILGMTHALYEPKGAGTIAKRLGCAMRSVHQEINHLGSR